MRTMFFLYLTTIGSGLVYFIVIGLMDRASG